MSYRYLRNVTVRPPRYKAFISYSHAADGQLAPKLQAALHKFAKPWYRMRAIRVFRDDTNLSISPDLWLSIEKALGESEYFLLLASSQAAESKWVDKEVDFWLSHKTRETLLIVLTEGELSWNSATADFDWTATTSLPARLSSVFPEEPLFLDLRWARTAVDLSPNNPTFRDKIADLSATLQGVSKDEIVGEDVL
jgi:TIR domain